MSPLKIVLIRLDCTMRENIDWEKIRDGFRGFEKLAVEFVSFKYKNVNWEDTAPTRDGNTDAIAIIMGYQLLENQPAQWWMEAKYSNSTQRLTRYRIDSTVVSAILDGTVEKVVFVTNITVDAKTISDITETLRSSSRCKEVEFYTKYSLEYWLLTHAEIYVKYFEHKNNVLPVLVNDFIVSQEITYYDSVSNVLAFKEPRNELIIGKEYIAYVGIFASKDTTISIEIANNLKGVRFTPKVKNLSISKGENTVHFRFVLTDNYGYKNSKRADIPMPVFKIGKNMLTSYQHIQVLRQNVPLLNLVSQDDIYKKLKKYYNDFLKNYDTRVIVLGGKADVGKSTTLTKFLAKHTTCKHVVFYHEFTESTKENIRILLNMLVYILFPYVPPETIDETYISSINNTDVKYLLQDLILNKKSYEDASLSLSKLLGSSALLPNGISINQRVIALDNMHLLDKKSSYLVSKIVCEIYEKKLPVYFILCGQPNYFHNHSYKYLAEKCVINLLIMEISINDILANSNIEVDDKYDLTKLNVFDMDATSLLLFQRYLMNENTKVTDLQELVVALRVFWLSDIVERHILDCFKTILLQGENYRVLLDKIYWSCQPVKVNELITYQLEIDFLLRNALIKYNADGEIIASNSIYQTYYRKHYLPNLQNLNYKQGTPEYLRIEFLTTIDTHILSDCMRNILNFFEDKSYYKIYYVLKETFISDRHITIKNMICKFDYYHLYYIYAYAAHQCGETKECQVLFEKIQKETYITYDSSLLQLSLKCLWELAVISFENMQYFDVIEKKEEAIRLMEKICIANHQECSLLQYINYHDFCVLDAIIQNELYINNTGNLYKKYLSDMQAEGFVYRALSFSARYALSLCSTNTLLCIQMLYNTGRVIQKKYGTEDKHYLWCMFYYYFYRMIYENNHSLFEQVTLYHEKMRVNQYGNYRKKLYGIAAYLYSIEDVSGGNQFLFQDTIFPYEARNRYLAFYYETVALHAAINSNCDEAVRYLDNAIALFGKIESYSFIPRHNKKLLTEGLFSASRISFLLNDKVDASIYYIDPRSVW